MNHIGARGFLLVKRSHKLRVVRHELWVADQVWIFHFEGDVKSAISLQCRAIIVALKGLRGLFR